MPAMRSFSHGLFGLAMAVLVSTSCRAAPPLASPTPAPLFRAEPLASPSAIPTATAAPPLPSPRVPTVTTACQNDARFVADLTVPDGTIVSPGEVIDKRWSVLNAGTCNWVEGYRLVRVGSGAIIGPDELALYPARAGATAEIRVELRAPDGPGEYLARYRARGLDGALFGEEIYILIFVEEPTPTASASPSPTP